MLCSVCQFFHSLTCRHLLLIRPYQLYYQSEFACGWQKKEDLLVPPVRAKAFLSSSETVLMAALACSRRYPVKQICIRNMKKHNFITEVSAKSFQICLLIFKFLIWSWLSISLGKSISPTFYEHLFCQYSLCQKIPTLTVSREKLQKYSHTKSCL